MMVRNVNFSYNQTQGIVIPNFRPEAGDFLGQGNTTFGKAPGFDFSFGLVDESYIEKAGANGWLIKNEDNVNPAIFGKTETFRFTALVEPFTGMKINLNADRVMSDQHQLFFMYENMTKRFTGNFNMTAIALRSAFEKSSAENGYFSKSFATFLNNREIIANRLEQIYANTSYPNAGFLQGSNFAGKPYNPANGKVDPNSTDVLIPAFLAAYTNKNPYKAGLDFFPSLIHLLPNWRASYEGLIQIPFINKYFKSFVIDHEYKCNYIVGAYSSYLNWVEASNGIGFIRNVTTDNPIPASPFDITAVSINEAFNPLIGVNSVFLNNMSLKLQYRTSRNINLNVSSYQIVEMKMTDVTAGLGIRVENFNQVLKLPKTGGANFNNDLRLSGDVSYRKSQSLIRKIQDAYTQPTSGDSQIVFKFTADYNMSKMIVLQAFFDRQISNPLISSTAYPLSKSSFGVNIKVSLVR
jgi:cell surface protein SprA